MGSENPLREELGGRREVLGMRQQVEAPLCAFPHPSRLVPRTFYLTLFAVGFLAQAALAQPVLLQIRPHIGDTLRMHLSQTVEITGTTRGARSDPVRSMTTSIEVFTRAIALRSTSN